MNNATQNKRPFRCDCVKLKKAIQTKIYEETKYLTPAEMQERLRLAGERFDREIDRRRKAFAEREAADN